MIGKPILNYNLYFLYTANKHFINFYEKSRALFIKIKHNSNFPSKLALLLEINHSRFPWSIKSSKRGGLHISSTFPAKHFKIFCLISHPAIKSQHYILKLSTKTHLWLPNGEQTLSLSEIKTKSFKDRPGPNSFPGALGVKPLVAKKKFSIIPIDCISFIKQIIPPKRSLLQFRDEYCLARCNLSS